MERSEQTFVRLREAFYEAAFDPTQWQGALAELRCASGPQGLALGIGYSDFSYPHEFMVQSGFPDDAWAHFTQHHMDCHLTRTFVAAPVKEPYLASRFFDASDFRSSPFYADFCRQLDMNDFLGLILSRTKDGFVSLGLGYQDPEDVTDNLAFFREVRPEIDHAFRMHKAIWDNAGALAASLNLESFRCAALVIDRKGRIVYENMHAEHLFRSGRFVRCGGGRTLHVIDPHAHKQLRDFVEHRLGRKESSSRPMVIRLSEGGEGQGWATLTVAPLPPLQSVGYALGGGKALVLIGSLTPKLDGSAALLAEAFGLTPQEARVLERLMVTKSLPHAAADLGMADSTARHHMKSVYAKLGVTSQIELTIKILSSPFLYLNEAYG